MDKNTIINELLNLPKPRYDAELPLDRVVFNPYQPRDPIGEEDIEGMKAHIRSGILEPVIVHQKGAGFELIAGERRLRAAKALGMAVIPAMVYPELTSGQVKMMSLQENLGRKNLDWLEIARGYQALADEGLTHEQIAGLVGVDRATVTHRLRLLGLPEEVKIVGRPTFLEGHAAALLQLETPEEQIEAFREWQKAPVTVKSFRKIVKRVKNGISEAEKPLEKIIAPEKVPSRPVEPPIGAREWQITKNFLLSFSRNPETGHWRLALEAWPMIMISTALTIAAFLVLIFGTTLVSNFFQAGDERISQAGPTEIVKPPVEGKKAILAEKQEIIPKKPIVDEKAEYQKIYLLSEPYWADVWFKDEVVGRTPMPKLMLPVGKQVLFLENTQKGTSKTIGIEVVKDTFMRITIYMDRDDDVMKLEVMEGGGWKEVGSENNTTTDPVKRKPATKKLALEHPKSASESKMPLAKKTAPVAKKPEARKPVEKPKPNVEYGYLTTNAVPRAYYKIDGKKQPGKDRPIIDLKLPVGKHKIEYSNPYLGITKEVEVELVKGKTVKVIVILESDEVRIDYKDKKP